MRENSHRWLSVVALKMWAANRNGHEDSVAVPSVRNTASNINVKTNKLCYGYINCFTAFYIVRLGELEGQALITVTDHREYRT